MRKLSLYDAIGAKLPGDILLYYERLRALHVQYQILPKFSKPLDCGRLVDQKLQVHNGWERFS